MTSTDIITLTTEEGHEVALSRRDFDTLKAWPRLDIGRLVVVGEDAVHARRTDGTVHPQSLEDLLDLTRVPAVLKPVPADPAPSAPSPGTPRPGGLLNHFMKTGDARPSRRALAGEADAKRLPTVLVAGEKVLLKAPMIDADGLVRVPVTAMDSREVAAWAWIPQDALAALRAAPLKPDTLAWAMDAEGRPTTRIKRAPEDMYRQPVADLLGELGMDPALLVVGPPLAAEAAAA